MTPRDAASLILLDRSGEVPKVLMGQRGAGAKFMPSKFVFPGGAVDAEDFSRPLAAALRPEVCERLRRSASADLARALGVACARELAEETGLCLGEPPDLSGLDYLCRAITPADRPIRFDARFFVADAAIVRGTLGGSGELGQLAWYAIDTVLELDLPLATRVVLARLEAWSACDERERHCGPVPVLRDRGWTEE